MLIGISFNNLAPNTGEHTNITPNLYTGCEMCDEAGRFSGIFGVVVDSRESAVAVVILLFFSLKNVCA